MQSVAWQWGSDTIYVVKLALLGTILFVAELRGIGGAGFFDNAFLKHFMIVDLDTSSSFKPV